jgi:3-methylfumaryl-CoA hydratase
VSARLDAGAVGAAASLTSSLPVEHAQRVAAVFNGPADLRSGDPLPLLWHWAFFAPPVPSAGLGRDGHPVLDPDGPTAGLPRRMWVGGCVEQHAPLVLGAPAVRRSTVTRLERKSGRSGHLLFVTIEHTVEQSGTLAISERQDLVYRAAGPPIAAPEGDVMPEVPSGGWLERQKIDPITLFRFSAVTFNSHRIHYDRTYATADEGYPALVVHGPLTAILLANAGQRHGSRGATFEFRASAPLFEGLPFTILGSPQPDASSLELAAVRNDGVVAVSAHLR